MSLRYMLGKKLLLITHLDLLQIRQYTLIPFTTCAFLYMYKHISFFSDHLNPSRTDTSEQF